MLFGIPCIHIVEVVLGLSDDGMYSSFWFKLRSVTIAAASIITSFSTSRPVIQNLTIVNSYIPRVLFSPP